MDIMKILHPIDFIILRVRLYTSPIVITVEKYKRYSMQDDRNKDPFAESQSICLDCQNASKFIIYSTLLLQESTGTVRTDKTGWEESSYSAFRGAFSSADN